MSIQTVDGLIARISSGYEKTSHLYANSAVTRSGCFSGGATLVRGGFVQSVPGSLESGVSAYLPTEFNIASSTSTQGGNVILAELIDLGSIDTSGASGTFTDGSVMPTRTELGVSRQIAGPVWCEVEAALNSNAGSLTVTYTDQDGNTSQSSGAVTLANSAPIHSGSLLPLATGDTGVVDITAASRAAGSSPSGTVRFWGIIPIAMSVATPSGVGIVEDLINSGMVRRLGAGSKLAVLYFSSSLTASSMFGSIRMVGDS